MLSTSNTCGNIHICKLSLTCKYEHGVLNGLKWAIIIQAKIETLNSMTLTWMHNQLSGCTKNISLKMKEV